MFFLVMLITSVFSGPQIRGGRLGGARIFGSDLGGARTPWVIFQISPFSWIIVFYSVFWVFSAFFGAAGENFEVF